MKNIAVINFTKSTNELGEEITQLLNKYGYDCILHHSDKCESEAEMISPLRATKIWIEECFRRMDALIFIGGADIAIRMISKLIEDKMKDPAVLVIDEACKYVIPILGNHLGLGNDLAEKLSGLINTKEIITTPKVVNETFMIEKFAERNHMEIGNRDQARTISSAILEGQHVGFYCEYDIEGEVPSSLTLCTDAKSVSRYIQRITIRNEYVVGMGVKEGVALANVEELFLAQIDEMKVDMIQIKGIATIKERAEEPALVALSEKYKIPILGYSGKELRNLNVVHHQDAVLRNEANISERSAIMGSECGELVKKKVIGRGATFAAARKVKTIYFD